MKNPIKTFIIEEHHEAFIVWNYAIQQGLISSTGNTLFHVDEHSDMGTPRFNESIHRLNGNFKDIADFTYKELNIAGFIMPAIYRDIFNKVYWIRQKHRVNKIKSTKMYVRSYNQAGKRLMSGKVANLNTPDDLDRRIFHYYLRMMNQVPSNKEVILDIDLDFFSCSGNPNENQELDIEITKQEFERYTTNRYHRINFCNPGRVEAVEKEGKYFYVFNNYRELYPADCRVDQDKIDLRIDEFVKLIIQKSIKPKLISLCRSRFSGYTPIDQWSYIENTLLSKLKEVFEINIENNDWIT